MKPTVIGSITTLILLIGIPLLVDGLLYLLFTPFRDFSMTGFLLKGYFGMLPLFICYLLIAAAAIYLWNKKMKKL
jgi:hypothetical protein